MRYNRRSNNVNILLTIRVILLLIILVLLPHRKYSYLTLPKSFSFYGVSVGLSKFLIHPKILYCYTEQTCCKCWTSRNVSCNYTIFNVSPQTHLPMTKSFFSCFFLDVLAKPEAPTNCSLHNVSSSSLTVSCSPGFDGGLNQTFAMEVYGTNPHSLKANITSNLPRWVSPPGRG